MDVKSEFLVGVKDSDYFNSIIFSKINFKSCPGGLSAHMEGPSKPDLQFKNNDDGTVTVSYKPTAAGTYKLHIKFTHYHLPGN